MGEGDKIRERTIGDSDSSFCLDDRLKRSKDMHDEMFKDAPLNGNGIPIVSATKMKEIMGKYGFRDATQSEGS